MTLAPQVLTVTMARLYADQGYLRKAAAIYRQLLDQQPDRQDLAEALAGVEEQIKRRQHPNWKELGALIREWAELQKTYARRKKRHELGEHREKDNP